MQAGGDECQASRTDAGRLTLQMLQVMVVFYYLGLPAVPFFTGLERFGFLAAESPDGLPGTDFFICVGGIWPCFTDGAFLTAGDACLRSLRILDASGRGRGLSVVFLPGLLGG